jgi:PPOX class probable F420-dependent enzyme
VTTITPIAEPLFALGNGAPTPLEGDATWDEAQRQLAFAHTYWLATGRPDGRPHVMPVLGVWEQGVLCFATSPQSRKGRNLARRPHCVVTVEADDLDLVIEGSVELLLDPARHEPVRRAYAAKYGFAPDIEEDGGSIYAVTPSLAFAFPTTEPHTATRWRF